jgi:CheY-like chemotaxis protein
MEGAKTILLVEDEDDIREIMHDILAARGHRVVHACDGAEALLFLEERTPDVILLDMHMPGMNGWEFLACRALTASHRRVPVVVVSARVDGDRTIPTCEGHLAKPFTPASLLDVVERVVS